MDLPFALGLGISSPEHAGACAAGGADGVIVGSAIIDIIEQHLEDLPTMERELRRYISRMKEGAGSI
jgi:tryptophan synthase alpha chain